MDRSFLVKILLLLFIFPGFVLAGGGNWQTDYEKSGLKKTPRYRETIDYCRRLSEASQMVTYRSFGTSPQGRDLPLVIADKDGNFTSQQVKASGNVIVLIQAGIHAGEISGKDAGLMLLRDIVIRKKYFHLLDRVTLLFIPIFNVDGHERFGPYNRINQNGPEEMGWRVTAQNLNLNRDFLKADTPEMQAWLLLFNKWLPDLLVDCHATDGADYQYQITYGIEKAANVAPPVRDFTANILEPFLKRKMLHENIPMNFYVMFRDWSNINSGLRAGAASPRFSTGYGAVQNRVFFLIETHMLKSYRTRVEATYHLLIHLLEAANEFAADLKTANREADRLTAEELPGKYLPLNMRYSPKDSIWVDFLGVESDKIPSKISGTYRTVYHSDKPKTYRLPYFNRVVATDSAMVPYAYLIPREWQLQIERLKLHGVKLQRLKKDTTLRIVSYRFKNVKWKEQPYEGRHRCSFQTEPLEEERFFPAGTFVVPMNQRTNRVTVHLLEPGAPDSFVSWGFWDAIFERKEYAEYYVLEKIARDMLQSDSQLKAEFENKLATDSVFAASPRERLYFFYRHSPYWDRKINLYPVAKLMQPIKLPLAEEN